MQIGRSVQVKENTWGIRAAIELASWKRHWGDSAVAEQLCREVIRLSADRPDTVAAASQPLISSLLDQGRFAEAVRIARPYYEKAWEARGQEPEAAVYWSQLYVRCLRDFGDFETARTTDARAYDLVQERFPALTSGQAIGLLQRFGNFLAERGELMSANRMWRLSAEEARQRLVSKHPDLAATLVPVAGFLVEHGSEQDANELVREILEIQREKLGREHLATTETELLLAEAQEKSGDAAAAISRAREAQQIRMKRLGLDDLNTIDSGIRLARLLRRQQQFEEAEALLREAVGRLRKRLLVTDERWWNAVLELSDLLLEKRDFVSATTVLEAAQDSIQTVYPPRSWRVAEITSRLGLSYSKTGKRIEAQQLLENSSAILTEAFGAVHPRARQARDRLERHLRSRDIPIL